ncbi:XdhC family protein [candidate division WOR-3 bacterium]|nr:XdhC family protein [candidate division WOR-3 bacterium]
MLDIYEEILKLKKSGGEGVLITVVGKDGHGPASIGDKMLVLNNGKKKGTVGGGAMEEEISRETKEILKKRKNILKRYVLSENNSIMDAKDTGMICGGNITLFYEHICPCARIYIFGAGHIGKALAYHLKNLDYYITLIDNRENALRNYEGSHKTITGNYTDILKGEYIPQGSFFIVTTYSHELDYVVLKRIYEAKWKPKYIGLVASQRKGETILKKLLNNIGKDIDLSILYTPVGLDIGGTTPDEIAISIISEIQSLRYGKKIHKHLGKKWSVLS